MSEPALKLVDSDPFKPFEVPTGTADTLRTAGPMPPPMQKPVMHTKDISDYIRTAPERYLACREGRHRYPRVPLSEMRFIQDGKGYDIFTVDCEGCGAAYRQETWLIVERKGLVVRMEFLGAVTAYYKDLDDSYLLSPGNGRLPARDLRQTRVADHFVGGRVKRQGSRGRGNAG